jgi:hypothetical protein
MSARVSRLSGAVVFWGFAVTLVVFTAGAAWVDGATPTAAVPATGVAGSFRVAVSPVGTEAAYLGPDVVMLEQLVALYEPVPFDHRTHAKMAQMWDGCVTCHHRTPSAPLPPGAALPSAPPAGTALPSQDQATGIPACKSCHPADLATADIHMPALKGAYHRQCLNCHKEWMHENACDVCHRPRQPTTANAVTPTRDDILGRMHPPIPEPEAHTYRARYTPADGSNVLFRHKEHTVTFGLRCTVCHRHDNCAHCHDPNGDKTAQKPLRPGLTWADSHGPCMGCHQQDRCRDCHYKDGAQPPAAFAHAAHSGQELDKNHASLACSQCHAQLRTQTPPTCGDSACHKNGTVSFPAQRPGAYTPPTPSAEMPASPAPAN